MVCLTIDRQILVVKGNPNASWLADAGRSLLELMGQAIKQTDKATGGVGGDNGNGQQCDRATQASRFTKTVGEIGGGVDRPPRPFVGGGTAVARSADSDFADCSYQCPDRTHSVRTGFP